VTVWLSSPTGIVRALKRIGAGGHGTVLGPGRHRRTDLPACSL
jgi:hypothetical protein